MDPTGQLVAETIKLAIKQGWFDKLVHALQKKHRVLLLGCTGTGKSNLLLSLTESLPKAIDAMHRTEFVERHRLKLNRAVFDFIDVPGQKHHKSRRQRAIDLAKRGGAVGVINVVCDGYHEYRYGKKHVFDDHGRLRTQFMTARRRAEVEALKEWVPHLSNSATTKYLITVVSKADIWWDRRDTVLKRYEQGKYFHALGEARALSPVVLAYCSVVRKFYGRGRLARGFDDRERDRLRANLIRVLLAAVAGSE